MNDQVLKHFSESAQHFLRATCDTPEKTVAVFNGLMTFRGALRVGVEIMEKGARPATQGERDKVAAAMACNLAVASALECFMSLIGDLHPETGKIKAGPAPGDSTAPLPGDHDHIIERFKHLDE